MKQISVVKFLICISLLFGILLAFGVASSTSAQEENTGPWSVPVNISHSGGAKYPVFTIDAKGIIHILWEDVNLGLMYAKIQDGALDSPMPVVAPFNPKNIQKLTDLKLVPDPSGRIHAFWMNQRGELFYSMNQGAPFTNRNAWSFASSQIERALGVDAVVDARGAVHMLYINAVDTTYTPAGIYYRSLEPGSRIWSRPVLLYSSQYYRSTEREIANVQIASGGTPQEPLIYAVWDNRLRRSVFMTRSGDGGRSWLPPVEVDRPTVERAYAIPSNIRAAAFGDTAMIYWQSISTSGDNTCQQFYQWTSDKGINWSAPQEFTAEFEVCPEDNRILTTSQGNYFLISKVKSQVYLTYWNGSTWSAPQIQDRLYSFQDPELYSFVQLRCKSALLDSADRLVVVGCDEGVGADVWLLYRSLGDASEWFPEPSIWSDPIQLTSVKSGLSGLEVISDPQGRVHSFWSQAEEDTLSLTVPGQGTAIVYNQWDGQEWSQPFAVLKSPNGKAEQPAAAIDPDGRIYVVWGGGTKGEIYFSWANIDQASTPSGWATPLLISDAESLSVSPDIVVEKSGVIKVVYAIPINEQRGIYFVQSQDYGRTWSEPTLVFDAVVAGWEKINYPRITYTTNGGLHLLWSRYSLNSDRIGSSFFYARSNDGGITWTDPEMVVEESISWLDIIGVGEQTVHRVWEQVIGDQKGIKFQISNDGGLSWSSSDTLFNFTGVSVNSVTTDSSGQIHLIYSGQNDLGEQVIDYWKWQGSKWVVEEGFSIPPELLEEVDQLGVAFSKNTTLTLIYGGKAINELDGLEEARLYTSTRPITLLPAPPSPKPTEMSTEVNPQYTPTPSAVPQVTATAPKSTPETPAPNSASSDATLVVLAIGSGVAIVSVFIAVLMRLLRSR